VRLRPLFHACLLAPLLVHALPLSAAETPATRPSPLAGVSGLAKPVSYTETKIPLGELVQKVAADTGVKLTATRDVADELVAVVVKAMPARELLEQLADLLDYQWSRRGKEGARRYEIYQDLAARNREAALRERRLREVEARFREELQLHAGLAALPSDAFQRLLTATADCMRQKRTSEQIASRFRTAEGREQMRRDDAVHSLQSPAQRTLARLVNQLLPEQWDRLRAAGRLTFSTDPAAGELPLPGEFERLLRSGAPTWRTQGWWQEPPTPEDEVSYRDDDQRMQEAWSAQRGYRVTLDWEIHPLTWRSGLSFAARVEPITDSTPNGSPVIRAGASPGGMLFLSAGPFDVRDPDEGLTPQRRVALAQDPVAGAVARYRPDPKAPLASDNLATGEKSFQEFLPELARLYRVSFLADAYWSPPRRGSAALPTEPTPLYALLDRLIGSTHRWDRHDRLIRLRSRTWFMARPCEVPLRLVRQWNDLSARNGALPLDTFAEGAAVLSDEQVDSLNHLVEVAGLSADFGMVSASRQVLRLYATLTPAQRLALWQHRRVSLARITPAQRLLLAASLREVLRGLEATWTPEQLASASLSLEEERLIRVREQRGNTVTQQEFGPGATELDSPGRFDRVIPAAASSAKPVTVTRYPIARVHFVIYFDGGWSGVPPMTVSPP
jgi:hypothetical protein